MRKKRIVIICGYKSRELQALLLLKKELELSSNAEVSIIGGISEIQRMYYLLYKIQPDVVFISQVVETVCRKLANYVLISGGLLYVLPAEITIISAIEQLLLNPAIKYDKYLSRIFIPGVRYAQLLKKSDINKNKITIVGSPKIDCLLEEENATFMSKKQLCLAEKLDIDKKNLFIFTSFVKADEKYLRSDKSLNSSVKKMLESNICVELTLSNYIRTIKKLSLDFPNWNIIIKPHPLEEASIYMTALKDSSVTVIANKSLYDVIKSVDLAIHWSSTVSSECWVRNIKTLQYAPYKKYNNFLTENRLGNPLLHSYAQLKSAIKKYAVQSLEQKYLDFQTNYLKNNFFMLDGKSCKRISSIVTSDLNKKRKNVLFRSNYHFAIPILLFMQKLFGISISRKLLYLFSRNFSFRSAVENYVYET